MRVLGSAAVVLLLVAACSSACTAPASDESAASPLPAADPGGPPSAPPDAPTPPDPRQKARDASIFHNLDFEVLDAKGAPAGWACACAGQQTACKVDASAKHGSHALVLGPGCYAYQSATAFDASKAVRFDYFAYGAHAYGADFRILGTSDGEMLLSSELAPSKTYASVASNGVMRTDGLKQLRLYIVNSTGIMDGATDGPDLHVDDIVAVQDAPNPPPQVGSILSAHHVDAMGLRAGSTAATLFTPLPLDYASQVPLYLELKVDPPSVVESIEYVAEDEHDWGALVHFAPGASAPTVRFVWDSVVLVRATPHDEIPQVFTKVGDPSQWTQASAIAESDYPPLASTAAGLAPTSASPEDKMKAVIAWTSSTIGGVGTLTGLDAKTVYDTHVSSCTGFANTAMAMGRAMGVPTRHVLNIMVGESQQMHSIDEFWLGEGLGWRRVEPQSPSPFVRDDYAFVMRLVLPADEVGVTGGFSGIPQNEFTEYRDAAGRFTDPPDAVTDFTDCSVCLNRADRQSAVRGSPAEMATLLATARAKWQADRASYLAGGLASSRMDVRRKALGAKTAADVSAILSALP